MSLKVKLLSLIIIVSSAVIALSWLSYQQSALIAPNTINPVITQHTNQAINKINNIFEKFGETNQKLMNLSIATEESNLEPIAQLANVTNDAHQVVLIYSISTQTLYAKNKTLPMGNYSDLESIILDQVKSPRNQTKLGKYQGKSALIFSNPILVERELTGLFFNLLVLDKALIDKLSKHTNSELKLSFDGNTLTTDNYADNSYTKTTSFPISQSTKIVISVTPPSYMAIPESSNQLTLYVGAIIFLLVLLMGLSAFLLFNYQRIKNKFRLALIDANSPHQVVNNLKELELPKDWLELQQKITEVVYQQIHQNKQMELKLKQNEQLKKDYAEQKSALKQERDSAVLAPKTKSEFLSRMGDEITTPMKTLTSMLHLLSEYSLSDEPKELLSIARRSSNTLINNLNNILDFSKLDAELLKLHKSNFNIKKLVKETISEYEPHAKAKSLNLTSKMAPDVPESINTDSKRIKQILKNLIGNAIRFTKSGSVNVETEVFSQGEENYLRFRIKDTGVGIPPEAQAGLFDSLERETKLNNSSFAGRLRLIVSKKLSELMGGEIGVSSELNEGSEFWFTIRI
ncbi:MAG: hypothetical protein HWE27_08680 [Gammaproteobacteria bacterium]|nr:hypothetical protein [Gammaproteobacteria bacterium]